MTLHRLACLLLTVALATPAALASAQPAEPLEPTPGHTLAWDQAKVGALTQQLADSMRDLRREFRQQPTPNIGSMQSRAHLSLDDNLRLIESESRELAGRVARGASQEESFPVYRRMWMLIRDARQDARRLMIQQGMQDRIARAREILVELDAYYD